MFPLTNTNSSSVSRNNLPLVTTCVQTHANRQECLRVLCWTSFCVPAGRGGDSAESCRRPRLRPSPPLGPVAQPFSVFWKAGRQVKEISATLAHSCSSSPHLTHLLTVTLSGFISQAAVRKSVQHQHQHKYLRVPGSQKSSECYKSDVHHYSGIQRIGRFAYNCIANHSPLFSDGGSMWKLFVSNRPSFCLVELPNKEQCRVRRGINQTLCVQPPPAARRSQVFQREVHSRQQPQCLLPPHSQVMSYV